ncbi:MAG: M48 family metalloprotease [Cyanobacteria bacterium P01_D01_bin.105]
MAISRTREFVADEGAAEITGNPLALVSALEKLEEMGQKTPIQGNPAYAPLFIVRPIAKEGVSKETGARKGLLTLFMTHPSTEERIKRLKEKAQASANIANVDKKEAQNEPTLSPAA